MKSLFLLLISTAALPAFANQAWDFCNAYEANLAIEEGQLVTTDGSDWDLELGTLLYSSRISKTVSYCTLEQRGEEVVAANETITSETYEIYVNGELYEVEFECNRGYSEVPNNDSCLGEGGVLND
jgi:hypothetical protein